MTQLIREDPAWAYPGYSGVAHRRLRVWRTGEREVTAVLTEERDDLGTSITGAARQIIMALEREYPGDMVRVVEHYPWSVLRYSGVELDEHVRPRWFPITVERAREMLPGIEPEPEPEPGPDADQGGGQPEPAS
jgi:hypothetical protein